MKNRAVCLPRGSEWHQIDKSAAWVVYCVPRKDEVKALYFLHTNQYKTLCCIWMSWGTTQTWPHPSAPCPLLNLVSCNPSLLPSVAIILSLWPQEENTRHRVANHPPPPHQTPALFSLLIIKKKGTRFLHPPLTILCINPPQPHRCEKTDRNLVSGKQPCHALQFRPPPICWRLFSQRAPSTGLKFLYKGSNTEKLCFLYWCYARAINNQI